MRIRPKMILTFLTIWKITEFPLKIQKIRLPSTKLLKRRKTGENPQNLRWRQSLMLLTMPAVMQMKRKLLISKNFQEWHRNNTQEIRFVLLCGRGQESMWGGVCAMSKSRLKIFENSRSLPIKISVNVTTNKQTFSGQNTQQTCPRFPSQKSSNANGRLRAMFRNAGVVAPSYLPSAFSVPTGVVGCGWCPRAIKKWNGCYNIHDCTKWASTSFFYILKPEFMSNSVARIKENCIKNG